MRELDYGRVARFVAGYHSTRSLSDAELAAIPVCLRCRGLQTRRMRPGSLGASRSFQKACSCWRDEGHRAADSGQGGDGRVRLQSWPPGSGGAYSTVSDVASITAVKRRARCEHADVTNGM